MDMTPPGFKVSHKKNLLFALVLSLAAAGCTIERQPRGFFIDEPIAEGILPGLDNKTTVQYTMGTPSMYGTFDPNVWYYISELTRRRSLSRPTATTRTILAVRFDGDGVVEDIRRYSLVDAVKVKPRKDITPTRGKKLSFFEQIFSNVGRFSQGGP